MYPYGGLGVCVRFQTETRNQGDIIRTTTAAAVLIVIKDCNSWPLQYRLSAIDFFFKEAISEENVKWTLVPILHTIYRVA